MAFACENKRKEYMQNYYIAHIDLFKERARESEKKDPSKQRRNYLKNKEKRIAYSRKRYENKKDDILKKQKDYYRRTKNLFHKRKMDYQREYRQENINKRLRDNLSRRIWRALKGKTKKSCATMNLIGCSIEFLKGYLDAKFDANMSWNNYGDWHIDHIMPCAKFDLNDKEQQLKCFHYSNLQPLWAEDNIRKGAK